MTSFKIRPIQVSMKVSGDIEVTPKDIGQHLIGEVLLGLRSDPKKEYIADGIEQGFYPATLTVSDEDKTFITTYTVTVFYIYPRPTLLPPSPQV